MTRTSESFVKPTLRKARIIIAKPGLDGHDKGALVVARALRDAGFEVIYLGLYRTIDEIVEIAIQESADIIGVSILSGTHLRVARRLVQEMRRRNINEIKTVIGGIIPYEDALKLKKIGITCVIPTGTPISKVAEILEREIILKRQKEGGITTTVITKRGGRRKNN